jgi:hypothetical protein
LTDWTEQDQRRAASRQIRGCVSLRNSIYWSTMIGIFSAILVFQIPFRFLVFDGIMLVNLLLLMLLVNFGRIAAWIPCFLLYIAASGVIGIAYGTDTIGLVAKEFLGIAVSVMYFYYFFRMIDNDFERAFASYTRIAYWFVVVAYPLWICACVNAHGFERLKGLTTEPGAFCELVLPAFYWFTYQFFKFRKHGVEASLFAIAIILSGSSNGYICTAFGVMLLLSGRIKHFVVAPAVVGGVLVLAYVGAPYFRVRADDTLLAISTQDVGGSNYSTYALISNLFVTQQVLKENPIIGNGIGSHLISHDRFIGNVSGIDQFRENDTADLNAPDAASLTLRSLSELGILGFSGILVFLISFRVGGDGTHAAICNAILVCFFFKLIRDGNYFAPEQFFFVFIYILNHRQSHLKRGPLLASAH